jgi:hypothetical protein
MDGTAGHHRLSPRAVRAGVLACAAALFFGTLVQAAENFSDPAEGPNVTWGIELQNSEAQVLSHRRQSRYLHGGKDAEELRVNFRHVGRSIAIYRSIPPTQALEDLKASLWVRCRIKGLRLGFGVTFPHQNDPDNQAPLFTTLAGPPIDGSDRFQEVSVTISRDEMSRLQTLARGRLGRRIDTRSIDFRDPYIDQVVLYVPTGIGPGEVQWDDLVVGPIVPPADVQPAAAAMAPRAVLSWADNRLLANGSPILPRFVTYQGEPSTLLSDLKFSATWIQQAPDRSVLEALTGEGLGVFASPPLDPPDEGGGKVSLPPLGPEWNPVDCWMLGRLDSKNLDEVARWTETIQDADRQKRLLLGDVAGHVREFHRCVPLLGVSRHIPQTSLSPEDYLEFLETRRQQALAGRPMATLLPTEVADAVRTTRRSTDREPVMEPEQIALCAHLAAASGYKLFGFWTNRALDSDAPGMEERRQMLKLLNIELQLLEPWLASGSVIRPADVRIGESSIRQKPKSKGISFNPFANGWTTPATDSAVKTPYRATILRGTPGMLVLVDCVEEGAQFQPGPMSQQNLRFLTMRYDDTPTAFEVTTTSVKQIELDLQPVAGGMEVVLKDFDQHAAIVVTSDLAHIEALRRAVQAVASDAATASVALATAKLERVEKTHLELQPLSPPVPEATQTLQYARQYLRAADDDLHGRRYDEARRKAQRVLMLTRSVQRAYWNQAVKAVSSPVAYPHTICFETLPDHWRMVRRLNAARSSSENLLRSGDFEDQDAVQAQWTLRSQAGIENPVSLNTRSAQGKYSLALTAMPSGERTPPADDPLVLLYSPSTTVQAGQLVRVTGKVLVPRDLQGGVDGLVIYDTLNGSVGAHRFRKASPPGKWQTFEMYRDVLSSGEFRLVFELRGWGEAWIDDLHVSVIEAEPAVQTASGKTP